jgi:RNA recognition motif-containing protein
LNKRKDFSMNIYIGNLSYEIKEDGLRMLFNGFGKVENAKIIMDRFTGRSKGFGFVEMPDNSKADQAIRTLNGKLIEGQNIRVYAIKRFGTN